MNFQKSLAAALVATTVLSGVAFATEKASGPAATQETPAQKAIDKDFGKLSKDGAQAFRDMHLARVAIYDADPAQAKTLIGKAQAALTKAKTDDTVFNKAEDELKTRDDMTAGKSADASKSPVAQSSGAKSSESKAAAEGAVAWIPVDAQLTLGEDFQATPVKATAVAQANKHLATGDKKTAMEKLRLADVDVNLVMAVLPVASTLSDVNQAATLIGQGKYYEANTLLKTAEDRMRFDMIDVVGVQKAAANGAGTKTAAPEAKSTK